MSRPPAPRRFGRVNWLGVWTVCLRDLVRCGLQWKACFLAPAIRALLFLLVFQMALGADDWAARVGDLDYLAFLAPGLLANVLLKRSFEIIAYSLVLDRMGATIGDILGAPVTPAETIFGYMLLVLLNGALTGLPAFVAILPFLAGSPASLTATLFFAAGGALTMGLFGVLTGLWARSWEAIQGVPSFVLTPLIFLSGVFFPVQALPEPLQLAAALNPVYYVIDGIRWGLTGQGGADPLIGAAVIALTIAVLGPLCWILFRRGYGLKT